MIESEVFRSQESLQISLRDSSENVTRARPAVTSFFSISNANASRISDSENSEISISSFAAFAVRRRQCFSQRSGAPSTIAIAENDETRMQDLVMETITVMNIDDLIGFAPDDQRGLVDQVSVHFQSFRSPVPRRGEHRMMRVGGSQGTHHIFYAMLIDQVVIERR